MAPRSITIGFVLAPGEADRLRKEFDVQRSQSAGAEGDAGDADPSIGYGIRQQLEYALQRRIGQQAWYSGDGVRDDWQREERERTQAAVAYTWFDEHFHLVPKDPDAMREMGSWGSYLIRFENDGYRVVYLSEVKTSKNERPPSMTFSWGGQLENVEIRALSARGADDAAQELLFWIRAHAPGLEPKSPAGESDTMQTPSDDGVGRVPGGC